MAAARWSSPRPEVAKSLKRPLVKVMGAGEATKNQNAG